MPDPIFTGRPTVNFNRVESLTQPMHPVALTINGPNGPQVTTWGGSTLLQFGAMQIAAAMAGQTVDKLIEAKAVNPGLLPELYGQIAEHAVNLAARTQHASELFEKQMSERQQQLSEQLQDAYAEAADGEKS